MEKTLYDFAPKVLMPKEGDALSWDILFMGRHESPVRAAGEKVRQKLQSILDNSVRKMQVCVEEYPDKHKYSLIFETSLSSYEIKDMINKAATENNLCLYSRSKLVQDEYNL